MAFGMRGGRRFKEKKINLCQKGCICKGMAVANAQDGMGKMSHGNHITLVWGHS